MYLAYGIIVVRAAVANHELAGSTGDFPAKGLKMASLQDSKISAKESYDNKFYIPSTRLPVPHPRLLLDDRTASHCGLGGLPWAQKLRYKLHDPIGSLGSKIQSLYGAG